MSLQREGSREVENTSMDVNKIKAAHARYSPSGSAKWMECAGSLTMEEGIEDVASDYANEGTCGHWLADYCLKSNRHPTEFIGLTLVMMSEGQVMFVKDMHPNEFPIYEREIDDEFADDVATYVEHVREYAKGATLVEYEQRIDISSVVGVEGQFGTADCAILTRLVDDSYELQLHDLKLGYRLVIATLNKQLRIYALGRLTELRMFYNITRIRIVIHQPRVNDKPLEWDCSVEELDRFGDEVRASAIRVEEARVVFFKDRARFERDYLKPSAKACEWCRAAKTSSCSANDRFILESVADDFDVDGNLSENTVIAALEFDKLVVEKPNIYMATAKLGSKMAAVPAIEEWCKNVRAEVERRLLAGSNSKELQQELGFKLVGGRKSRRQWSSEDIASRTMAGMGLKIEQMYRMKLISPAQAEAMFKAMKNPASWEALKSLVAQQAEGKPSVAPLSDPRDEAVIADPTDDFDFADDPLFS